MRAQRRGAPKKGELRRGGRGGEGRGREVSGPGGSGLGGGGERALILLLSLSRFAQGETQGAPLTLLAFLFSCFFFTFLSPLLSVSLRQNSQVRQKRLSVRFRLQTRVFSWRGSLTSGVRRVFTSGGAFPFISSPLQSNLPRTFYSQACFATRLFLPKLYLATPRLSLGPRACELLNCTGYGCGGVVWRRVWRVWEMKEREAGKQSFPTKATIARCPTKSTSSGFERATNSRRDNNQATIKQADRSPALGVTSHGGSPSHHLIAHLWIALFGMTPQPSTPCSNVSRMYRYQGAHAVDFLA